ncbi:MAG: hypothetical protein K0R03_1444 [Moraxellaceae bacterium]|jgi:hypothetical protein|nr:hypothetical protein [Moraxellaceae bacterium]
MTRFLPFRLLLVLVLLMSGLGMAPAHAAAPEAGVALEAGCHDDAAGGRHAPDPAPAAAGCCDGGSCDCTCALQLAEPAALLSGLLPPSRRGPLPYSSYQSLAPSRLLRPPIA